MLSKILLEDLEIVYGALRNRVWFGGVVLLTGAAGFLGCKFSLFFCRYGRLLGVKKLVLIDLFFPSWFRAAVQSGELEVIFIESDVIEAPRADSFLRNVDYIIHLATFASPVMYRKKPLDTAFANVLGLKNLVEGVSSSSLKKMLVFSSSEIYGDPIASEIPTSESYNGNVATIGPRACYDESKRFLETMAFLYSSQGFDAVVVRPFNNFGPTLRLDDGRVISDFVRAVLDGNDIEMFSNGRPTRTFLYSSDALIGYLLALNHKGFDVFNVGLDSGEVSIIELAHLVSQVGFELIGRKSEVVFLENKDINYLVHNPQRRRPDITKARGLLDFSPAIDLKNGIERTLLHHIEVRNA